MEDDIDLPDSDLVSFSESQMIILIYQAQAVVMLLQSHRDLRYKANLTCDDNLDCDRLLSDLKDFIGRSAEVLRKHRVHNNISRILLPRNVVREVLRYRDIRLHFRSFIPQMKELLFFNPFGSIDDIKLFDKATPPIKCLQKLIEPSDTDDQMITMVEIYNAYATLHAIRFKICSTFYRKSFRQASSFFNDSKVNGQFLHYHVQFINLICAMEVGDVVGSSVFTKAGYDRAYSRGKVYIKDMFLDIYNWWGVLNDLFDVILKPIEEELELFNVDDYKRRYRKAALECQKQNLRLVKYTHALIQISKRWRSIYVMFSKKIMKKIDIYKYYTYYKKECLGVLKIMMTALDYLANMVVSREKTYLDNEVTMDTVPASFGVMKEKFYSSGKPRLLRYIISELNEEVQRLNGYIRANSHGRANISRHLVSIFLTDLTKYYQIYYKTEIVMPQSKSRASYWYVPKGEGDLELICMDKSSYDDRKFKSVVVIKDGLTDLDKFRDSYV